MPTKLLFLLSLAIGLFYLILYVASSIVKIDHPLLSFIQEIGTIPALVGQLILFFLTIKTMLRERTISDLYLTGSLLILLVSIVFSVGSIAFAIWGN